MDSYIDRPDFTDHEPMFSSDPEPMLAQAQFVAPTLATTHWESTWFAGENAFDPSYERATEALRRWVDGMEAALAKPASAPTRRARKPHRSR
jgi:hypothetical protein